MRYRFWSIWTIGTWCSKLFMMFWIVWSILEFLLHLNATRWFWTQKKSIIFSSSYFEVIFILPMTNFLIDFFFWYCWICFRFPYVNEFLITTLFLGGANVFFFENVVDKLVLVVMDYLPVTVFDLSGKFVRLNPKSFGPSISVFWMTELNISRLSWPLWFGSRSLSSIFTISSSSGPYYSLSNDESDLSMKTSISLR